MLNSCEGVGIRTELMQRRPLKMVLLKGTALPMLFGHCIIRGKTQLTVTTPTAGIWQVGGEIAERLAHQENSDQGRLAAMHEVRRCLPGVDFSGVEIAIYPATRAEAKTAEQKRPSGVHISRVATGIFVGWPTKLSMAPILAEEVFALVHTELKQPAGYEEPSIPWVPPCGALSLGGGRMVSRSLGQTGLIVSRIGLGTTKLGRNTDVKYPKAFPLPSDKQVHDLLETALTLGVNLIDTAPAYGSSESRLAGFVVSQRDRFCP